ncbi:hypothetical protein LguiA_012184 [Lonicera macranthoides]
MFFVHQIIIKPSHSELEKKLQSGPNLEKLPKSEGEIKAGLWESGAVEAEVEQGGEERDPECNKLQPHRMKESSVGLEVSQRVGASLPTYTTFRLGLGHLPVFSCIVELAGIKFTSEPAKNKKQAEKNAAMAA